MVYKEQINNENLLRVVAQFNLANNLYYRGADPKNTHSYLYYYLEEELQARSDAPEFLPL